MSKGARTREAVTTAALELATTVGIENVTIGAVADRVGLSKSGVYAHYRSRGALQLAVLASASRRAGPIFAGVGDAPTGLPQLRAYFEAWLGWSRKAGLPGGCPFAAAMFEVDDVESVIRAAVEETHRQLTNLLEKYVADAIVSGELDSSTDVMQVVWELSAIYLGHHAAERFLRDPAADRRALTAFDALMDRFAPASRRRRN